MKRNTSILLIFVSIFVLTPFLYSDSESVLKPMVSEKFIAPDVCGQCHDSIHGMWDGTMHSMALDDPLFVSASKLFVGKASHQGELYDAEHCVACHNPIAFRSGKIKGSSDDYGKTDKTTQKSISCDLCHSMSEIVSVMNAMFNAEPGDGEDNPGTKRGPRPDAEPMYHEAMFSKLHTSSEICGTCHNVVHTWYKTKLEGTYDEWAESPYNSKDETKKVTCQDCHMRQSPGKPSTGMTERPDYPGSSAEGGVKRPNIYRHSVVGGNFYIPQLLGKTDVANMAKERLSKAAVIEIIAPDGKDSKKDAFTIRVTNKGAGHYLPTGVTEFREIWLRVKVSDSKGTIVKSFGDMDVNGNIPEGTFVFNTVFGDSLGNPTINVTKAAKILKDNRIAPMKWTDCKFALDKKVEKPYKISAELVYRSMNPSLVKTLIGDKSSVVPETVMAKCETEIR